MSLLRRNWLLTLALGAVLALIALGPTSAQIPGVRVGGVFPESVVPPEPPPDNPPDTTGPTVTITTPSGATHDNGSSTSMIVSGEWTDASGQLFATDPVTWDNDADMAAAAACTPGVGTFYSCNITGMVNGASNDITITVKDVFGNSGTDAVVVTVTIPMGGSCVAGNGACVDNVDDTTPSVAQTLTASGQDLHQRVTTNWDSFFTANLARHSFEGTNGSQLSTLGYAPGTGTYGHTVDNTRAVIGNMSAYFRSTASLPIPPPCGGQGLGIGQSYTYANLPNDTDFWFREYMYWTGNPWINGYAKHLELPSSAFLFQPEANSGNPARRFIANRAGSTAGGVLIDGGANMTLGRWYFVEAHVIRNLTTGSATFWVDGIPTTWSTGQTGDRVDTINFFGIVNACSTAAWDITLNMDSFVRGQARLYPDAEIWLCDGSGDDPSAAANPHTIGCVWQVPVSISDTSIQFTFRKTQHSTTVPSGTGYIIVVNNERQLSNATAVTVP